MHFEDELIAASNELLATIKAQAHLPAERRLHLPAEPLATFNAALAEGARLHAILVKLGRERHPMTLPTIISVAEVDDLRLIVLHHTFLGVFADPPEPPRKN
jgi:hypothetical protein